MILFGFGCSNPESNQGLNRETSYEDLDSQNHHAHALLEIDIISSLELSRGLEQECREAGYPLGVAKALSIQGHVFTIKAAYDSAILLHRKALDIRKYEGVQLQVGKSYNNISEVYSGLEDYTNAQVFADSAYKIYSDIRDFKHMAGAASNKAIYHIMVDEVDSARSWFRHSLDLAIKSEDRQMLLNAYNNYGLFLIDDTSSGDSSVYYINKAFEIALRDSLTADIPGLYLSLGQSVENENPEDAIRLYDSAIKLARVHGLNRLEEKVFQSQIELLWETKKDEVQVVPLYDSFVSRVKENYNNKRLADFARYEVLYETRKKEAELVEEQAKNERKTVANRWLITSFIFVVLLLGFFMFTLIQKRRLAEREKQISKQKIDAMLRSKEVEKLDNMLEVQEKERNRIASDLHDRLGSILSAVKLNFSSMEERLQREEVKMDDQYLVVKGLIDEAATEVRRISHDMASSALSNFGLLHAVSDLKKALETSGKVKIEVFEHGMDERLVGTKEVAIYRIIQELVSNALKHAKANQIDIHFTKDEDHLTVIVEDDGVGFVEQGAGHKGIGLTNIEKRVKEMDGTFAIEGNPKSGTSAVLDIVV